MTSGGSASLNPAAQKFKTQTDEVRPNAPQGPSNRDTGNVLNHYGTSLESINRSLRKPTGQIRAHTE
jgi:hypothetical protein